MDKCIEHVHFQITRNCNLRCSFCGQWGKKGFFSDASGVEMVLDDWKNIINQLIRYREKSNKNICVTVWGGEPLISPFFDEIMKLLKFHAFETEVITNGVLIDRHMDVIENYTDRLYVSIDGTKEVHDAIRGDGVYDTVISALKNIRHENITVMSVVTKRLIKKLPVFLNTLNGLYIKELLLHDMIGLTSTEIEVYKSWLNEDFGIKAYDIYSWENNELYKENVNVSGKYNYRINIKRHTDDKNIICKSPFKHVHVTWNGNIMYCTDFYDFSAGNVKDSELECIFLNDKSDKFRAAISDNKCPTCCHCSWRCN